MEEKNKKSMAGIFDLVSIIALAIIAVALSFTFVFRTITVVGSSMYPTLRNGDRIILTAFYTEPEYGDIVVTGQPCEEPVPDVLVKRVIATEGQTVDIDFNEGIVYVDGVALEEPYVAELTRDREDFSGPIVVPEDHIFAMGDNRNASTDSRDRRVGFIREEYILGKALFRMLPFGQFKIG